MMTWLIDITQQYGLPTALLAFFIWRDWQREKSMAKTIDKLTKEMRDILKGLVEKCCVALVDNTNVMREIVKILGK